MTTAFSLHQRLQDDCEIIGYFDLCQLLVMNDCQYPWFILVPEIPDICEIYQLMPEQQQQLVMESSVLAKILADGFQADKMNIAAIGNLVPQLHLHHVVRYKGDMAWPGPIWGKFPPVVYDEMQLKQRIVQVQNWLLAASEQVGFTKIRF